MIDPGASYGQLDADTLVFLQYAELPPGARVLEVGANEEPSAAILCDKGHSVVGVDLRPHKMLDHRLGYLHIEADFVKWAEGQEWYPKGHFDAAFSTSALEHFGIEAYGHKVKDSHYDAKAVDAVYNLLKPGGSFYVTVPYGADYIVDFYNWKVYCRQTLQEHIIRDFKVQRRLYFKSAECMVPDAGRLDCFGDLVPLVQEASADAYWGVPPHLTVFLHLIKE